MAEASRKDNVTAPPIEGITSGEDESMDSEIIEALYGQQHSPEDGVESSDSATAEEELDVPTPLEYGWTGVRRGSSLTVDSGFEENDQDEDDESLSASEVEDAEDVATPLDYHWTSSSPRQGSSLSMEYFDVSDSSTFDYGSSEYDMSGTTVDHNESVQGDELASEGRVPSVTFSDLPSRSGSGRSQAGSPETTDSPSQSRMSPSVSRRRHSISVKRLNSIDQGDQDSLNQEADVGRRSTARNRKSMRRQSFSGASFSAGGKKSVIIGKSGTGALFDSVDSAVASLGQGGNTEWQNVAAAAAVVAGSTLGGKRSHVQFAVNEKVLVFLNILNHTNSTDNKEDFTVNPVNKFGYPGGLGNTIEEQQGPYVFVIATVKRVHFDEDVRYYTVVRGDTGTEQRADTEWMEPLKSWEGQEAAMQAAMQTGRSATVRDAVNTKSRVYSSVLDSVRNFVSWPCRFARTRLFPMYVNSRRAAKVQVTHILFGDSPFRCKFRITGINILVFCSLVYLFIEPIKYAFLPADSDYAVTVFTLVVWIILVLELFFEWLIRPAGYFHLIASDKAFAPTTARHINRFHLVTETCALLLFIPEFSCLHGECGRRIVFTNVDASLRAVLGPSMWSAVFGRFCIGLTSLRMVGLVRHWKQMWISCTFNEESQMKDKGMIHRILYSTNYPEDRSQSKLRFTRTGTRKTKVHGEDSELSLKVPAPLNEEDQRLKKAATIGTALMVVNSHRAIVILITILIVSPIILVLEGVNTVAPEMVDLLQQNNIYANDFSNTELTCGYLKTVISSWVRTTASSLVNSPTEDENIYLLWAQVLPVRACPGFVEFQTTDGVITNCPPDVESAYCAVWNNGPQNASDASPAYFADLLDIRMGGISEYTRNATNPNAEEGDFYVRVLFNQNNTVSLTNFTNFLQLFIFLMFVLFGLTILRQDAGRLVLDPLQRMLKIVLRYAENPLAQTVRIRKSLKERGKGLKNGNKGEHETTDTDADADKNQLGNYETEQLINAITKIADLLRKCWGVAGAGIISSNLARTQEGKTVVFNPTVPGKRVYALFGFVGIDGFSEQLHALDRDVLILINDVAKVVHDEVYRWALGESGQCNKNLGSTFLMVFRIGDFTEVHERKKRATDVVFEYRGKRKKDLKSRKRGGLHRRTSAQGRFLRERRRTSDMESSVTDTLQLSTLPGIQSFTDRALLGMLKAFASLHRDRAVQDWRKDFRLVGAFAVDIIFGMDAGWAVEGAVGSEYKIDATYLSPHVNMAARMMTASKQYGMTILMSHAVEELLSSNARSKLRHLDTVYVKGSSVKQPIFTYDARYRGVDFFLFERSVEQADLDAESYTPSIWDQDQDLKSMRQHVTDDFIKKFEQGKKQYLSGKWKAAIETLKEADDIMITTVLEEGWIDYNPDEIDARVFDRENVSEEVLRLRQDLGDGACHVLISYMKNRNGEAPSDWAGVRELTSK